MNKKLLFATLSLAALVACTDNDFESQNQKVAENVSPVKFEVINNSMTRASMGGTNGNTIVWSATDGDLFTLYHGAISAPYITGYENATYKASTEEGAAALTTPSMIKEGRAIMVWPADTSFKIKADDALSISIPVDLKAKTEKNPSGGVENSIPYVSDLINIGTYTGKDYNNNTAGYNRTYPVYMRPMASQLTLKAAYGTTETEIAKLYKGGSAGLSDDEAIDPIKVTSVSLLTKAGGTTLFTKQIPLKFTAPADLTPAVVPATQWTTANNAWEKVTDFDKDGITDAMKTATLTTECVTGNESSKFLILPWKDITTAVQEGAVLVETYYGNVLVADPDEYGTSKYTKPEYQAAWYRYVSDKTKYSAADENDPADVAAETSGDNKGKFKITAKSPAYGMKQTINDFSGHKAGSGIVKNEPTGYSLTRYVNVNLQHLDMSGLHIETDKQLRDVARVWKQLGLENVTVILDGGAGGDAEGVFTITQKTIDVINNINKDDHGDYINPLPFTVKPCVVVGEECTKIVVTGGGNVRDMAFIVDTDGNAATDPVVDVVLKAEETWNWQNTVKVAKTGVNVIYNEGTLQNATTATLKTFENDGTQNNVRLYNKGTWNITAGTLNVQFDVTNLGIVNIFNVAQYRQDGAAGACTFSNMALSVPQRFLDALGIEQTQQIGKVVNNGVFATVANGKINNYGLIEHAAKTAKTYITSNQRGGNYGAQYSGTNKMGRINLPFSNKDEDNISISAAAEEGFVSVTVTEADLAEVGITDGILSEDAAGTYVNYIIVNSGITKIAELPAQIKYVEFDQKDAQRKPIEVAWELNPLAPKATYDGLIVLSDVNIKLGTTIDVKKATFLAADMYVAGVFKYNGAEYVTFPDAAWDGYYGATHTNYATKYITFK